MENITKSAIDTKRLGEKTGNRIIEGDLGFKDNATVLALKGDLGTGKTTFVQGLSKVVKDNLRIVSPTFILMRTYEGDTKNLYHIDTYRLGDNAEKEIIELGFKDIINDPKNIVVIEWADKISGILPKGTIWIIFESISESERKITFKNE